MSLHLKSTEEINALIAGDTFAAISTPRKQELANHFILMPDSVRAACLSIEVATLSELEGAFCLALFEDTDTPPPTPPPTALFIMSVFSGTAPLAVQFTETALGAVTSRSWTFGDAQTSALQNPLHTFSAPGDYTVTLNVSGPGGTDSVTHSVHVGATPGVGGDTPFVCVKPGALREGDIIGHFQPTAAMTLVDLSVQLAKPDADAGLTVAIVNASNASLGAAGELTVAAATDFAHKGGPLALAANTKYGIKILSYTGGGDDEGGGGGGGDESPLAAEFSWTQYNHGLRFDAAASTAPVDDPIVAWHWDFGDGVEEDAEGTITHYYDADGSWDVTLTVTTESNATSSATRTVTIVPPLTSNFHGETQRDPSTRPPSPAEGMSVTVLCTRT